MYFGLSEEQNMLRETVARFLEDHASLDVVRAYAQGEAHLAEALSEGLSQLGVSQLVLPEADGGAGLGLLEAALVQQELGKCVAPVAFMARAVLAPLVLREIEDQTMRQHHIAQFMAGKKYGVALTEAVAARENGAVLVDNGRLSGRLNFVLDAAHADYLLIPLPSHRASDSQSDTEFDAGFDDGSTSHEWACVAIASGRVEALKTIDRTRPFHVYHFDQAECTVVRSKASAGRIIDAARILIAADSFGAAEEMLARAVAYAQERQQFGRAIGSFQAVKHLCAEMAANLEPVRALLWYSAYAFDAVPQEAPLMSRLLKARMSEIGRDIARGTTEVHGGMGFTDLLGLHFWFKRIGVNRQLLGGPEHVRAEAAHAQGWGMQRPAP